MHNICFNSIVYSYINFWNWIKPEIIKENNSVPFSALWLYIIKPYNYISSRSDFPALAICGQIIATTSRVVINDVLV